jgi:ADP-ribosylglycohydrolase
MAYPMNPDFRKLVESMEEYGRLKHEYGSSDVEKALSAIGRELELALERLKNLPESGILRAKEPDGLHAIQALRADGPRRIWGKLDEARYMDRLQGALLGRMAGCTLGAPVEFWSIEAMERWAEYIGDSFPNQHYWSRIKNPNDLRYQKSPCEAYTLEKMDGVPVDDDIAYTLLGLLLAEEHGPDFTVENVGEAWLKYLPYACTAEDVALKNLKAGIPARKAADVGNPYCQWIGADIRSDPWGYIAPGWPEKAAAMAWTDASLSHRRNGIYGEMFFSAAISAAFAMDDPMEALRAGMTEIPRECALYKDVQWALDEAAISGITAKRGRLWTFVLRA